MAKRNLFNKLPTRPEDATSDERRASIMLVDDEPNAFFVLAEILRHDYTVYTAESGEKALQIFRERRVDLIISDQRMPGMSGVELLRRTMELDSSCIRIILTAYPDIDVVLEAVNSGQVYGFVIKPWDPEAMRATVRRALEHRDMIGANHRLMKELCESREQIERLQAELHKGGDALPSAAVAPAAAPQVPEGLAGLGHELLRMRHSLSEHAEAMQRVRVELQRQPATDLGTETVNALTRSAAFYDTLLQSAARIEEGDASGEQRTPVCDATVPVAQAIEDFRGRDIASGRTVSESISKVPPCGIQAESLRRVLAELLENAAVATAPGGEIQIGLQLHQGDVCLVVADNGCGIPKRRLGRIWTPGFTTRRDGRPGLGLSEVRRLVEEVGGVIWCDSEADRGSTFVVRLAPIDQPPARPIPRPVRPVMPPSSVSEARSQSTHPEAPSETPRPRPSAGM